MLVILSIVNILVAGKFAPEGDFFLANFFAYTLMLFAPVGFLMLFFNPRFDIIAAGALAILLVFVLEHHWETALLKGPNSMPFILYVIFCAPLTLVGCCIGYWFSKMLKLDKSWFQLACTFGVGLALGTAGFIKEYF